MGWMAAGAGIDALTGRRDNMFNKKEADRARDWAKEMANTEMQRRVLDLQKAGLNPMLAITEGAASTPSSAQANAASRGTDFAGAFTSAATLKLAKEKNAAEVAQINANTAKTVAETKLIEPKTAWSARDAKSSSDKLFREMELAGVEVDKRISEAEKSMNEAQLSGELLPYLVQYQKLLNQAAALGIPEKEADAKFFSNIEEGSRWMRLIKELLQGIRSMR